MTNDTTENMTLWDAVCETDPKHTKHVNQRGGFTAINAQYQMRMATEVWGRYGDTWRVDEQDYDMICDTAGNPLEATLFARFCYPNGAFYLSTDIQYKPGNDTRKKLLTDLTTKALSKLGFNADVFMGAFDDNKYVQDTPKESGQKRPEAPQSAPSGDWKDEAFTFGKHKGKTWRWFADGSYEGERFGYLVWITQQDPETDREGKPFRSESIVAKNKEQIRRAKACIQHIIEVHDANKPAAEPNYGDQPQPDYLEVDDTPF